MSRALILLALLLAPAAACGDEGGELPRAVARDVPIPDFDADAAYALLERQVAFGPRAPGLPGHRAQLEWMQGYLRQRADTVVLQPFTRSMDAGDTLHLTNVFARFRSDLSDRLLLVAHWDTRPIADEDPDADRRDEPILGANDGASGTAVLLQLADVLSRHSPPVGVDLLFVDGEDVPPGAQLLGSTHFAANPPGGYRPLYGIVVDMVADADPVFPVERHSRDNAPSVVRRVWRTADELGYGAVFVDRRIGYITDDHVPLNRAGIPTIDIIDLDYGPGNRYWHTHADDLERTAPDGLAAVGTVLTTLIFRGG